MSYVNDRAIELQTGRLLLRGRRLAAEFAEAHSRDRRETAVDAMLDASGIPRARALRPIAVSLGPGWGGHYASKGQG